MAGGPVGDPSSNNVSPGDGSGGWQARWRRSALGELARRGSQVELMRRSMAFATQGLVTLVPLLIVVAAIDPFPDRGFGEWVTDGMAIRSPHTVPVVRLFTTQHEAAKGAGVLSLVFLVVFGLAFVGDIQVGYEKIWGLPPQTWKQLWRQVLWLGALTAYVALEVESASLLRGGFFDAAERVALLGVAGLLFFWWGQHLLLGGRVPWKPLLPGAIATMIGLGGLRVFSAFVFDPMIVSNAESYGVVGVVLVVVSWLIGVGFIFYGGTLVGKYFDDRMSERRGGSADLDA